MDDPIVDVEVELGLVGRSRGPNLFRVGIGLKVRFFVGERIIWILVVLALVTELTVTVVLVLGFFHLMGNSSLKRGG